MAQDNAALCEDLYRRLANAPHIIGNTSNVREHAQALTKQNIEIRKLRLDMRRHECGSISITPLGGPNDAACRVLRQMLSGMEQNRQDILSARNQARSLVITNHETRLIRADIQANNCTPPEFDATTVSVDPQQDLPAADTETPADTSSSVVTLTAPKESSIIQFNTPPPVEEQAKAPELPPVPERDYDPSKPVRMVGPVFLPDASDIDLANPADRSAQQRQ
ncbi:hypothetical protein [Neorhizobium sp. JUb45]|uniref:hypothetical protein n=1 Tax=unclassified Neorhizobium TaxID=2629175 RepID=UPI001042F97E|nr:hypothetical protein [Neorhizobium sp. JUb45]